MPVNGEIESQLDTGASVIPMSLNVLPNIVCPPKDSWFIIWNGPRVHLEEEAMLQVTELKNGSSSILNFPMPDKGYVPTLGLVVSINRISNNLNIFLLDLAKRREAFIDKHKAETRIWSEQQKSAFDRLERLVLTALALAND
ncbi:hypothetical protein FBUS_08632 [Fasciolopsis buskii]|uniref:Uncharacterized protein n=1 Tax=Fasciolopsis buskii TaxID=27845 RepID=A0A8E0S5J7_9TREM|nr:hypothetical protein FBUS_08632 [Fasciolopsis buski]